MAICAVFNCDTSNDKSRKKNAEKMESKVKLFRFPKNRDIAKIWEHKCRRKDKINLQTSYICSKHFTQDQYFRNLQHELLNYSPKSCKTLKDDAIPTENLPLADSSNNIQKKASNIERRSRINRRHRQDEITALLEKSSEQFIECHEEQPQDKSSEQIKTEETMINTSSVSCLSCEDTTKLRQDLLRLQKQINFLHYENKELIKEKYKLQQECIATNKIFTPNQKKKMSKGGARLKWTNEDISRCIPIYKSGPKAYRFLLEKGYPYPAVITLKKWAGKQDVRPGLIKIEPELKIEN